MQTEFTKNKKKALYIQLYEAIAEDILTGKLSVGSKLPARRTLAKQLNVSQNTVEGAYQMLLDTGYITSVPRQGFIVSLKSASYSGDQLWDNPDAEQVVFSANGVDITQINRVAFAKIIRDITYNDGIDIFFHADKNGEFELRNSISKYLYSFRDVKCSPERIVIGAGAEYLLLSLAVIFAPNHSLIMETPCDTHFFRSLTSYENEIITLPYNIGSFDFDALYASKGSILFIEPDARFPRGLSMTLEERQKLLDWANEREDRYIIENCYDSEILWEPGKSLYSMDQNDKVIYLGSFARSLWPSCKTSYMVLPPKILELWRHKHRFYYALTSKTEQFALSEFIEKGYFTKHLKTMRQFYKDKSNYLLSCMSEAFGDNIKVRGTAGSTYVSVDFDRSATEITIPARGQGVKVLSMDAFDVQKYNYAPNSTLVFGFGNIDKERIRIGIDLLKNIL